MLGYPKIGIQGNSIKLTKGSISSLSGVQDDPSKFQISAPIQPGNSGGPLLDSDGNAIGVIVSQIRGLQNVNYAIKGSVVLTFMESVPEVLSKLKGATPSDSKNIEDIIENVKKSVVPILIY